MKVATHSPAILLQVVLALVAVACSSDVLSPPVVPEREPNRAPVAVGSIPTVTVAVDGTHRIDAAAYFSDPDGDGLSYAAASSDPGLARVSVSGSAVAVTGVAKGEATVTVTASDGNGGTAHQVFAVIVPNRAPEATAAARDLVLEVGGPARDVNLADWFSDPDGDSLVYAAASTDTAVFRVKGVSGSVVRLEAGKVGTAALEASATDSEGLSVGTAVDVTVSGDRAALEALYHATGGLLFWSRSDNWLTGAPLSEWYGVKVDSAGRVKSLELGDNRINGMIPPEIGNLTALQVLSLERNRLGGPIPPEIGNLTRLKHLSLGSNRLTGVVPPELVANLVSLTELNFGGNRLNGSIPPEIGNLTTLEHLSLYGNRLTGPIPPEVGSLAALESLWLGGNALGGPIPPELAKLVALEDLRLDDNALSGPIPPELAKLVALEDLRLDHNAGLCTPDHAPRALLVWLAALNVQPPTRCSVLTVALADERVALEAFYHSTGGPNWERSDGWLTDVPPKYWYGVATDHEGRVSTLGFDRNSLSGPIPPEIGNLTALVYLRLVENDLIGPIPPEIGNLAALESLSLNGNNLSGPIPPEIGNLAAVGRLRLDGNNLSGPIPAEIGNLAALSGRAGSRPTNFSHYLLDLGDNDLSGPIPAELATIYPVRSTAIH